MDKLRSMGYPLGLTMDPTKGGLALQGAAGLPTSHCLPQFSYDPGFAERAAKFSSVGYAQRCSHQQPYPSTDAAGKPRDSKPAENADGKLSRSSSLSARGSIRNTGVGDSMKLAPADEKLDIVCDGWAAADAAPHDQKLEAGVEAIEGATTRVSTTTAKITVLGIDSADDDGGDVHENSSCYEQQQAGSRDGKRKLGSSSPAAAAEGKGKASSAVCLTSPDVAHDGKGYLEGDETRGKRLKAGVGSRDADDVKMKAERSASEHSGDSSPRSLKASSKPAEPPKQDYIHVRARRGQATDSHSLAERVRREKISERMKFLQDLVPGCSKVTGKAVMLDEIINYVQSLQRQIEFLSMKLAAVNPRLDFNLDGFLNKEMMRLRSPETTLMGPDPMYGDQLQSQRPAPMHHIPSPCSLDFRTVGTACDAFLRRSFSAPMAAPLASADEFSDPLSQAGSLCDGDLQSIVEMGFTQGRQGLFTQGLHGSGFMLGGHHLKVEL